MKKIVNFSMAALVVMGTILAGCAKNEVAEPEVKDNIVTVTTTVSLDENAATKALAIDYTNKTLTKTFAVDDQVALVYTNTSSATVKAVSQALTVGDISADGKSASLTFTLTNPNPDEPVRYFYPASLLDANGKPDLSPLATQDGTLSDVASKDFSLCVAGLMPETTLPASVSLTNSLAIVAFTLKDASGTNDITSTITGMTISDGTNDYTVTRTAAAGPIYVIMLPVSSAVSSATIEITATDGTKNYTKTLNGKTFSEGNFYQQGLLMTEVDPNAPLPGIFSISAGQTVQFSKGNLQLVGENTWKFADNQWDYIGNAQADNHRDLFGWGTKDNPNKTSMTTDYSWNEWGENTALVSTLGTGWRTLTSGEWTYLFNTRTTGGTVFGTAQARYTEATINTDGTGVKGIILFPDGVDIASGEVTKAGTVNSGSAWATECTTAQWAALESKGCVFLPVAGRRFGTSVSSEGSTGYYWSSTPCNPSSAYYLYVDNGDVNPADDINRYYGYSVRLVQEVVTP